MAERTTLYTHLVGNVEVTPQERARRRQVAQEEYRRQRAHQEYVREAEKEWEHQREVLLSPHHAPTRARPPARHARTCMCV
jgi:hypothetical protein